MNKPEGYDQAKAASNREPLQLGGHICIIKQATISKTTTGKEQLVLLLDVADGKQKGYFQDIFDADTRQDKKWPCIYRQLTEGEKSLPFFKALITSIEESNLGYKWNWDEKNLKGKMVGGIFGKEQYEGTDGNLYWSTKCRFVRSTEKALGAEPPKDKYLNATSTIGSGLSSSSNYNSSTDDFTEVDGNYELPF